MREFWNQKFQVEAYKYGEQPNAFLKQEAGRIRPHASVLVPGDGEGRNGVGLVKAQDLARRRGVERQVQTRLADLTEWRPAPQAFDAVVVCYLNLPSSQRPAVMANLLQALKPGGLLILEAFHPNQLGLTSGGPKDVDLLYTLQALRDDASHSDVAGVELLGWEGEVDLNEGPFHQGRAQVTRWIWQAAG